jgi:hypothetical protein
MKSYILFLLITLFLTSCSDWLEEAPKSSTSLEDLVTNDKTLENLATGAYASLQHLYDLDTNLGVVGNDECMTQTNNANAKPLDRYVFTPSTDIFRMAWNANYLLIQNANLTIDHAWDSPAITDAVRNRVLGEMRFLRAFAYFRLVQWFGGLPLQSSASTQYDDAVKNKERASIPQVYELIISDLIFASAPDILPAPSMNGGANITDGRVTHYAAKALLAKVYLTLGTSIMRTAAQPTIVPEYLDMPYQANYYVNKSYDLLDELITDGGFSLYPDYGELFSIDNKNSNGESLWEIQFSSSPNLGSTWSKLFGQVGDGVNFYVFNASCGRFIYTPVPSFWGFYQKGDTRWLWNLKDWRVIVTPKDETGTPSRSAYNMVIDSGDPNAMAAIFQGEDFNVNLGCTKYRWGTGSIPENYFMQNRMRFPADNTPNNVIALRYADVLLMFAEADIILNGGVPSQRSVDMVNQILFRARGGKTEEQMWEHSMNQRGEYLLDEDGFPIPVEQADRGRYMLDYTTATLTYDELKRERARELCFEFHRWFDLVRWGDLQNAAEERLYCYDNIPPTSVDAAKHYLFPVPQYEIDICGFEQNPGYVRDLSGGDFGGGGGEE